MVGLTLYMNAETSLPDDALNNANGIAPLLEYSTLLNMQFKKGCNG